MIPRWLTDLEDPRIVVAGCWLILVVGSATISGFIAQGAVQAVWGVVWIVVSVAQVVWAHRGLRRWREEREVQDQ